MSSRKNHRNHLKNESNPYLLMHAGNPVDWYPWCRDALDRARKEDKPIIISIGYAACHWCHVMEAESFGDPEVAAVMNNHFISIKIDREERPDLDQVYMDAAQLLTGQGGWPLNVVALPDGRPIFAGTYFPKDQWVLILQRIHRFFREQPGRAREHAESVTRNIRNHGLVSFNPAEPGFDADHPDRFFDNWKQHLDYTWGGENRAPKFPLPIGWHYLLNYAALSRSGLADAANGREALAATRLTLDRMAMGGIYDAVGGGFARYSTDHQWKVPHFEKMLYDNGQLVSLYSRAYQATRQPLYRDVVYGTLAFVAQHLTSPRTDHGGHGFYSSLDADSEGEEGKFYLWDHHRIRELLGGDAGLIMEYYNVTEGGNWEGDGNILHRRQSDAQFAAQKQISVEALRQRVARATQRLREDRSTRVPPALDDKILTAWNALMLTGYVDAYRAFGEEDFLKAALANATFITHHMMSPDGRLDRNYKNGHSSINAFLDDYAFTIEAFIALYQATFDESWLFTAKKLLDYTLDHFYDRPGGMFYYTSDLDPELIARKMEIIDNVIPSSNSRMAMNLYLLGLYFDTGAYTQKSRQMLNNVGPDLLTGGVYYAGWNLLLTYFLHPPAEVAIVGDQCGERRRELDEHFLPYMILMGGKEKSRLPLLKDKPPTDETTIYVCRDKTCRQPVTTVREALNNIK